MTEADILWEYRMLTEKDKPEAVHDDSYEDYQKELLRDRDGMKVIS